MQHARTKNQSFESCLELIMFSPNSRVIIINGIQFESNAELTCIYHRSEYSAKTLDYFPQVCWLHVFRGINYELHASCFRLEDSPLLVLFGLNQAGEKFTIPTILQK